MDKLIVKISPPYGYADARYEIVSDVFIEDEESWRSIFNLLFIGTQSGISRRAVSQYIYEVFYDANLNEMTVQELLDEFMESYNER